MSRVAGHMHVHVQSFHVSPCCISTGCGCCHFPLQSSSQRVHLCSCEFLPSAKWVWLASYVMSCDALLQPCVDVWSVLNDTVDSLVNSDILRIPSEVPSPSSLLPSPHTCPSPALTHVPYSKHQRMLFLAGSSHICLVIQKRRKKIVPLSDYRLARDRHTAIPDALLCPV